MPWHTLGPGTASSTPSPILLEIGDVDVMLVRHDEGWSAIEDRCSHAGCRFSEDGEIDGATAVCDCHGSEFDVTTGAALRAPANDPIRTFPTRITDGSVEILVP